MKDKEVYNLMKQLSRIFNNMNEMNIFPRAYN